MLNLDESLYSNILKEVQRNKSSLFLIKKNNTVSQNTLNEIIKLIPDSCKYFHINYNTDINLEPYFPLCSIIKNHINSERELNNILDELEIYPAHKEIFKTYFLNGYCERTEEVLSFDFNYEKSKLYKSFLDILNYFSKDTLLLIILQNITNAPSSTIDWIKWLITNSPNNKFKIVLTLDDYCYWNSSLQYQFDDLIQLLELDGLILELSKGIFGTINNNVLDRDSIIANCSFNELLKLGDNYYNFFALDEALYCYNQYFKTLNGSYKNIPIDKLSKVLICLGNTYCLTEDYDKSLHYYGLLLNNSLEHKDEYFKIIATQKLSMVNILKKKFSIAENLAKHSYTLSKKLNDDELLFTSYTLIFWINELAKYRTTLNKFIFAKDFIDLAKKYNKKNMLAYFLTHSFYGIEYASPEDNKVSYYNEGQALAKELHNENCILSSYLKTALVYAVNGLYDISITYYKKVELLLKKLNNPFRLAQTYNGIGYYYLTKEKYIDANNYYDLALSNLKSSRNFDEICMTIFNKGFNYLLACNYEKANKCFNLCISIFSVLKVDRLRLTTLTRLYGIIGLNNYYLGNYYKAYSFLSNMVKKNSNIRTQRFKDDDDEYFLLNLLHALLCKVEGNLIKSEQYFEKANHYLTLIEGSLNCLTPKFMYEYSELLYELDKKELGDTYRNLGINYCLKNNYPFYLSLLENKTPNITKLPKNSSSLDWVLESAKQQASLNQLNAKVDEINFLNLFQENLSSLDDLEKVLSSSITLVENRFALDYTFMITYEENNIDLTYSSLNDSDVNSSLTNIIYLLYKYKNAFVYPDNCIALNNDLSLFTNKLQSLLNIKISSLIYVPILKDGQLKCSFLCLTKVRNDLFNNEITLNEEALRIINLSIKQLFETVCRIKSQQKLLQSAYTDVLTGLCNRQGFYNKLSTVINNNTINTITLFYIDLDNFKYYNDTFGHKIGDDVLIWFGNILKSLTPKCSPPIRYGGDEFILLLENYSYEDILNIANNIYFRLERFLGFTDRISSILNQDVFIPKEKHLSCSIGIVRAKLDYNDNLYDLIDLADKAMYEAKRKGKHQFIIADDIIIKN